jgi:hypothetical protein
VVIPLGWQIHKDVFEDRGPIALTNFGAAYEKGGIIPNGGATIDITSTASSDSTLDVIRSELVGAENLATDDIRLPDGPALRARFDDTYTGDFRYSNIAVYAARGSLTFKFYLTYRAGDAHAADFMQAFQSVLDSFHFTKEQ